MSDTPVGPGWWQASDGKFYAPELHPDYTPPQPAAAASGLQAGLVPVRLAGGGVEFGVNLKYVTEEAAVELLGKRAFDGEKRKTCVAFRDPTSQFRDSVRVETLRGHLVGWVLKGDSKAACQILDATTKALRKSKRSLRKQSFAFHISAAVEGEVIEGEAFVASVELRIKNPVTAEVLD